MKQYDDMVVGGGISGLSLALLLGMNGHRVLLLEKSPHIGGGLLRFYRQGIPFDTGFHFTGGFSKNGLLYDMLNILGIKEEIQPIFFSENHNRFIFEAEQSEYNMPAGVQNLREKITEYFPSEKHAIDQYFKMVQKACSQTVSMDLNTLTFSANALKEDFISLNEVLDHLTDNSALKTLLSGYCMCYGVKPIEISFANHSRVCFSLYESVARIKDGGEAFIKAFRKKFKEFNIDIVCGKYISECADIQNNYVRRFVLNTGEEVTCNNCILTIHPKEILRILPRDCLSKAFIDRVSAFESSVGFFSVFGMVDLGAAGACESTLTSLFPVADVNQLLDPDYNGDPALAIMKHYEAVNGNSYLALTAFEPSFPKQVEAWVDSKKGDRPAEYLEYKQKRINHIRERIIGLYPEYRDSFKVLDAASMLTFKDYLNSSDGSAYGIKQKIGQYNLFGKLPLLNMYAAGQSSVLPGLVGAMISSFIIARSILGKEQYGRFIGQKLCN